MKNTILIFAISLLMINCSKNDDAPIPNPNVTEENFLSGYLTATGFNEYISEDIGLAVGVESTLEFTPSVNGKIKSITVKIPSVKPTIRITIWEKTGTNYSIIKTETVNVTLANKDIVLPINSIALDKAKSFAISLFSRDIYKTEKQVKPM